MPAFMSIGKEEDWWVDPGEIKGDSTARYHKDWIRISSFDVEMAEESRKDKWAGSSGSVVARRGRREARQAQAGAGRGANGRAQATAGNRQPQQDQEQEKERDPHTLSITKPTDRASMEIMKWAQTSVMHDVQIDCCRMDDDYPFLSMVFIGVVPKQAGLTDKPDDTIEFTWKRAIVFAAEFDENNRPHYSTYAEFGEEEATSTSTTVERGVADYVAPAPDPNEGAGRGQAARTLQAALIGGLPPVPQESKVYDQERRALAIEKVGELEFALESLRGEERLSALFAYDLELRSSELEIDPADVVGHDVSFSILDQEGRGDANREPRYFSGVVTQFLSGEMSSDRERRYHATVLPTAWKLTQRSDCRVFQEVTVKDVVEKVFSEASFSDYDLQGVTRSHPTLEYCVQYMESDFAFVSRLLEEHGIFYYFKHEEGKHTMMLCDGPTGYVRCPEDPLRFAWDVYYEPRITAWRHHWSFLPGKFDSRDWNFTTPGEPVKGQSSSRIDMPEMDKAEIFEYPGLYADADQATAVADLRIQEREAGHHFVHAVGCYDSLVPGMTIAVEELPGLDPEHSAEKRWLVTGIRHHAEQLPEYGLSIVGYRNVFTCIPDDVTYVPPRSTPKPRMHGPQTAVVVGDKETEEGVVDTDKYGRVKVQFHWDRKGNKDKDSSCWIRVAQPHAGAGFGAMALPRIGWEVVVSFLEGDPDRPLVTGTLYNELHMPYHELPGAKHKTVWMTRSFPGGSKENFNELTFHDEKDKEEVYFHAERDFKRVVEHDDVLEVGEKESGKQTITVEGDQTITIKTGNHALSIDSGKSEMKAAQSIELKIGGNSIKIDTSSIELKVGGSSVKIDNTGVTLKGMNVKGEAQMQAEIKGMMTSISGDGMLTTKGGITNMQ